MSASKILLRIGASIVGTTFVNNGSFSDCGKDTFKVLVKHLKNDDGRAGEGSLDPKLLAQLISLASERSPSVTIISEGSRSNGSVFSLTLPALLLIGGTGYAYIRWKGLSLSDFMFVTRRSMSNAVSCVSKQLEQVSAALQASKRHLASRLQRLSGTLDQTMELQAVLKNEVSEVRIEVKQYGLEIETVKRLVESLGMKIDTIESKQDIANRGVVYLCNFVDNMQISPSREAIHGLQKPLFEGAGIDHRIGFKDLHSISDAFGCGDTSAENAGSTKSSDIHVACNTKSSNTRMQISPSPEAIHGLQKPLFEGGGIDHRIAFKDLQSISDALGCGDTSAENADSRGSSEIHVACNNKGSNSRMQISPSREAIHGLQKLLFESSGIDHRIGFKDLQSISDALGCGDTSAENAALRESSNTRAHRKFPSPTSTSFTQSTLRSPFT
ncbi:hypothetical protein KP509_31G063400 [Ceratopteris richardii]|uniref:DUF1664 domain-containing protein n=1 Tax=Ceratopteris richardii TaxID=49495 RepID=A0A8T2R047_CERRI|nr:hypothetical protein KP509_31G063400 [Ceratopteris richardii]